MTVYYTINGGNPVVGGRQLEFEEVFYIDKSAVVRAIGVNPDQTVSEVFEFEYIIRDDDQDGLPDWWEVKHFNGIESQSANSDTDMDGQTEMQEFLFQTYPNSSASFYSLDAPVPGDGPRILNWQAFPNRCYTVMGSTDLMTWQVLYENLLSIEGIMETVIPNPELKFFRITVRH